jgi:hypothetical protein
MLIKSVKRSFTEIELQAAHEKNLLKVNAHWKTRKIKLTIKTSMFWPLKQLMNYVESETKEIQWKPKDKASSDTREKTHCSSEERSTIREKEVLKRCLIILLMCFWYEKGIEYYLLQWSFTDLEEAWLEVIDV